MVDIFIHSNELRIRRRVQRRRTTKSSFLSVVWTLHPVIPALYVKVIPIPPYVECQGFVIRIVLGLSFAVAVVEAVVEFLCQVFRIVRATIGSGVVKTEVEDDAYAFAVISSAPKVHTHASLSNVQIWDLLASFLAESHLAVVGLPHKPKACQESTLAKRRPILVATEVPRICCFPSSF